MKKSPPKIRLPGKFDPQARILLWYFLATLLVLWVWQDYFSQFAVRTIPYSQFKAHLERREVVEAAVKPDEIVGRIVPLAARQTNAAPAEPVLQAPDTNRADVPQGLRRALTETKPFFFRTVRVEDPDLVKELQAAGVEFTGTRPSAIAQFLLAWVLPIGLMMLIWGRGDRSRSRTKLQRARSPEEAERREKAVTDINKRLERLRAQQQRIAQEAQRDSRRAADAVRKIMQQDNRRRA